jgi:Ca2+-binding EF-hand superfamily protein
MSKFEQALMVGGLVVWSFAVGMTAHPSGPQKLDKSAPKQETASDLLLTDMDQNRKMSKQEFVRLMNAEFDRLDTDHDGELDIDELARSHMVNRRRPPVRK